MPSGPSPPAGLAANHEILFRRSPTQVWAATKDAHPTRLGSLLRKPCRKRRRAGTIPVRSKPRSSPPSRGALTTQSSAVRPHYPARSAQILIGQFAAPRNCQCWPTQACYYQPAFFSSQNDHKPHRETPAPTTPPEAQNARRTRPALGAGAHRTAGGPTTTTRPAACTRPVLEAETTATPPCSTLLENTKDRPSRHSANFTGHGRANGSGPEACLLARAARHAASGHTSSPSGSCCGSYHMPPHHHPAPVAVRPQFPHAPCASTLWRLATGLPIFRYRGPPEPCGEPSFATTRAAALCLTTSPP